MIRVHKDGRKMKAREMKPLGGATKRDFVGKRQPIKIEQDLSKWTICAENTSILRCTFPPPPKLTFCRFLLVIRDIVKTETKRNSYVSQQNRTLMIAGGRGQNVYAEKAVIVREENVQRGK